MTKRRLPTLEDVAREANVSTATVSRCLNAPERVAKEKRKQVLAAVDRLGYAPNASAKALAENFTNTIGAIIPTMDNAIFARGIQAFQEALVERGMTLLIASSSYKPALEAEQIRTLVARGADGLLVIGYDRPPGIGAFLAARGVPVLAAWVHDADRPELSIGFDNKAAMKELAEVIIRFGHCRIGVISAHQRGNDRAKARVAGITEAMVDAALQQDDLVVIETDYGIETGAAAFAELMRAGNPPTVVMCGNDVLAVGALREAKRMGLKVPKDVSITGFDDIELATVADPSLTTVHVPHALMGRQAAEMLVDMVNGRAPAHSVRLETRICLRESLGKPPPR